MDHESLTNHVVDLLLGVEHDVLEQVLTAITTNTTIDLGSLSHDDVVSLLTAAVAASAGAATKYCLDHRSRTPAEPA
jgi:hypothetical protein